MPLTVWDDPRNIETLTSMWADGATAAEVADAIGHGVTRSAVCGRVARMKLVHGKRETPNLHIARARKSPTLEHQVTEGACLSEIGLQPDDEGVDVTARIGLMELNAHTCRWPYGDPKDADFGFCGAEPIDGKPYCAKHTRQATARSASLY